MVTAIAHSALTVTAIVPRGRLLASLKACLPTASKDTTRPHLYCVAIELRKFTVRCIATDGHTLVMTNVAAGTAHGDEVIQTLIPADDVRQFIKLLTCPKRLQDRPVHLSVCSGVVTLDVAGTVATCVGTALVFPAYEQVIPRPYDSAITAVGLNPRYLARAADAVQDFSSRGDYHHMVLRVGNKELAPVRIDYAHPEDGELTAVVMPTRMA